MSTTQLLPAGLHVLVVEDDPDEAFLVQESMTAIGFTSSTVATTVGAATAALAQGDVDLVVLDLGLPDADGLNLLELTRQGERFNVPVLVVTGDTDPVRRVRALELGAEDLLLKPFNLIELGVRAQRALRLHDDLEAAEIVTRTLAQELTVMEAALDERGAAATEALLAALRMRRPDVYARGLRVSSLVAQLSTAVDLPELAAQLAIAARSHEIGALALTDSDLAGLAAGDPLAGDRCEQASVELLHRHDTLAASAAAFRRPATSFERHIDRLAARTTSVCHMFDVAATSNGEFDPRRGTARLAHEDATGLDRDLIEAFVDLCVPNLRRFDL